MKPEIDSIFGVVPRYGRFWFDGNPVNHDPSNLSETQHLIPVHEEAADFYFFRKDSFKKYGKRVCGNSQIVEVSSIEGVDIDTIEDFIQAEALIKGGLVDL